LHYIELTHINVLYTFRCGNEANWQIPAGTLEVLSDTAKVFRNYQTVVCAHYEFPCSYANMSQFVGSFICCDRDFSGVYLLRTERSIQMQHSETITKIHDILKIK